MLDLALERLSDTQHSTAAPEKAAVATRIALVGGFTPRQCGIATFTADVFNALTTAASDLIIDVYAMTPAVNPISFGPSVHASIIERDPASYADAARMIDDSDADIVWIQHEFGLFGGPAGDMILGLVDRVAAPLMITMHTVIPDPDPDQMRVVRHLVARATTLIVMSDRAAVLLRRVYGADADQIVLIPHGVPDRPFGRSGQFKAALGFAGRQIVMTFGLLSPGKGIEVMIEALPAIVADHPDLLYCIVGVTHPNLIAREGEAYRDRLKALAIRLGVDRHMHWIDAFVETAELLDLIEAADIYVTPYPGAAQSTSGTLSYAVALGKAVVSTPYVHAVELLADGHGELVPFNDSAAMAAMIGALLDDPARLNLLQRRAYRRGRSMIWPTFAARCLDAIRAARRPPLAAPAIRPVNIAGLMRLCDDTGILQHSIHNVPDRAHGYCVDDNARALMLMNRLDATAEPDRSRLTMIFAAFVQNAWNDEAGEFRNFMGFARNWLESVGSEDSCGRALWSLGATVREGKSTALRRWARGLFDRSAASALGFGSPRATAFAMLGASDMLRVEPAHELAHAILNRGADQLMAHFARARRPNWEWFEPVLAYDNCRLSEAMIRAGQRLRRKDVSACGIASLGWIIGQQTGPSGHFRPVGSDSFGLPYQSPHPFDQQPVEAWATIDACRAAYDAGGDTVWLNHARVAYAWFGGQNDRGIIVGDSGSGGCHDGINPRGPNLNEGAESVLSFHLATSAMRDLLHIAA